MGFLADFGQTFSYEESKEVQDKIKKMGAEQFLKLYQKFKEVKLSENTIIWGDEIEYQVINMDPINKQVHIQTNTEYVFDKLHCIQEKIDFNPLLEYGSWMIETIPKKPFDTFCNIKPVLENMKHRRQTIQKMLEGNDKIFTISTFPLLGVGENYFIEKEWDKIDESKAIMNRTMSEEDLHSALFESFHDNFNSIDQEKEEILKGDEIIEEKNDIDIDFKSNPFSKSKFIHDEIICAHSRFYSLTKNIRERRKENVCIKIPIFKDEKTNLESTENEPYPGFIYMDAMAFGMGNSCIQMTFSTKCYSHARHLYDQLAILSPIFLALSASTPIFKGKLADIDTRWKCICQSVDDRTTEERDEKHPKYIPKSRYDSISFFIGNIAYLKEYNDLNFPTNKDIEKFIIENQKKFNIELDENIIKHLGFLFLRDSMNFNSTNWNSVRFKPPPNLQKELQWRVEFRTVELQLTDEENALFCLMILKFASLFFFNDFQLNFYLPISYVEKNFERSEKKNAILTEKFYFRKNIFDNKNPEIIELTLKDLFLGTKEFIGLSNVFYKFGERIDDHKLCFEKEKKKKNFCMDEVEFMLKFIEERVTGKRLTVATWIRNFVLKHPKYQKDSIISNEIAFDLLTEMDKISNKEKIDPNFLSSL